MTLKINQKNLAGYNMNKLEISKIKEGDFIKKEASIYLVKGFKKTERKYKLDYYFRSTKKTAGVLHINGAKEFYELDLMRFKTPTNEEIVTIINKITKEYPDFIIDSSWSVKDLKTDILSEKEHIDFLKERGYLIYKQI